MTPAPRAPRAWLTIHEASDLVGVSPATLRRWTEAGDVEAFVTPGGHRRFARSSILGLLPHGAKPRRRLRELGETPDRVVRQYRRELADRAASEPWVHDVPEADRPSFREPGRRILAGVLGFLDAPTPEDGEASLAEALAASGQHGAMARARGLEIGAATDAFLHFRLPFLHELGRIARRRRLATDEAMDLLLAASRVFDRLLLALLRGYDEAPGVPGEPGVPGKPGEPDGSTAPSSLGSPS
ncbi:MAG TPA: helix-turn-helix domain-containing protein [Candidatus Limnocylindrales bacterium]|nr:helix-turn-helix domain-containing protein [Candidatus Limnocylindrales bacterium]